MNTRYLVTLQAILETGSFQKAALKLNYTQSTVTAQMQQLEQELSVKLFERVGRKMELTWAGREILPYIERILQAEDAIRNYGRALAECTGVFRVAVPDELFCSKMQPLLQEFVRQAPHVQLVVKTLDCYAIREEVIGGGVDLGVHCDIGGYPETVSVLPLTSYQVCLAASPAFRTDELDFITPHQRKEVSLVVSDPHSVHQRRFNQYLKDRDILLRNTLELRSIGAARTGVLSGLGVAYFPDFTIEEELKTGALVPVRTALEDSSVSVILSYRKNKFVSQPMELFIRLLHQRLGRPTA